MSALPTLIESILSATAKVIGKVIDLHTSDSTEEAERTARRFVANSQSELDEDRAEAEDILDARGFHRKTDPPPPSG